MEKIKKVDTLTFQDIGICPWIERNLTKVGIRRPTAVQQISIPAILSGRDVLAASQTGSGKTAAFALPIIQRLQSDPYGVFAICLTPTRELAIQIVDQFNVFCDGTTLRCEAIIGGEDMKMQTEIITARPHIIVATPGRLMEHFLYDSIATYAFKKVSILVLDEADRLLEPSFDSEIRILLSKLPARRQTLLFSATITRSILALKAMELKNVFFFHLELSNSEPVDKCRQRYCFVPSKIKEVYLFQILMQLLESQAKSVMVFSNSIKTCELLQRSFQQLGVSSASLHSMKKQKQRKDCLVRFRSRQVNILFATDVASRGIDIPAVDAVINFDTPSNIHDYIHRVGRTSRADTSGEAVTFVTQHDAERFLSIEKAINVRMECFEADERCIASKLHKVLAAKRAARLQMAQDFDLKLANRATKLTN